MRKTKIVCTLGPGIDSEAALRKLIVKGMNVARINMSHGTQEEQLVRINRVKAVREKYNSPVAILMDTKGPEIRIKSFKDGKIFLKEKDKFTLTTRDIEGDQSIVSITYKAMPQFVKPKNRILINDGLIELEVDEVAGDDIICTVIDGGELSNSKSINLPRIKIDMPYISDADRKDLIFSCKNDVDYIALSFVRSADDVIQVRKLVDENGGKDIQLIAKIENREGVNNIDEILEYADGIMVARGDMGVEIPFVELPSIQKSLIRKCYQIGKKVITATQMLESMIYNPRPTRAEISDVANAIFDGSSAIMLSGETAVGKYPFETVKTMADIAEHAESSMNYKKLFNSLDVAVKTVTDAVSHSAVSASFDLGTKAIITVTQSGYTSRKVSRFRPSCAIIGATTNTKVFYQLALNWGVVPVMATMQENSDALFIHSVNCAKQTEIVKDGDLVVIIGSSKVGYSGNSDTLRIQTV